MLVLTRKPDQAVLIGDNVVVRVLEVRGSTVRLGIEAPRDVAVVRDDAVKR
jgi:carbon storage regulator